MWMSEAAHKAGVNVQTLRYYERRGLLPTLPRRASGYREVTDETVRIVRFIKRAQRLGFSLEEIEVLLKLRRNSGANRQRVRALAERQVGLVEEKIAELERMRNALRTLVSSCRHAGTLACPVIEALDEELGTDA